RNTALTYKGRSVEAKQIGRELNVRYILEGSIQHGATRMRVNVQLIDAVTGNHLWADRFDKPMADLFDMQDEIVSRLANQLRGELFIVEAQRAEQEPNPDSMDYYFRGVAAFNKGRLDNFGQARALFTKAVELDPTNIDALVGAARVEAVVGAYAATDDRREKLAAAEALLIKGLAFQPRNYWAHLWLGFVYLLTNRGGRGISELERALALNRNLGAAHALIGLAKITLGRAEEAHAHVEEAYRISPAEAVSFMWRYIQGLAMLHLGGDAEAADLFRRSLDENRNFPSTHFYLAAALTRLGRQDEAEAEVKAGLAMAPDFTIDRYIRAAESDNPAFLAQREKVADSLRRAGVPER
ncbi:MAG: tetratricopeptide repeat protein, partial [Acetobacteraceae bacterium]|nr:tetratricopeptide repeat protein [Acetobacteraceae bacterium]